MLSKSWKKYFLRILFFLTAPIFQIIYFLIPANKIGETLNTPYLKFWSHASSNAIFLVIILIQSIEPEFQGNDFVEFNLPVIDKNRNETVTLTVYFGTGSWPFMSTLSMIFVVGILYIKIKELYSYGITQIISELWYWIDSISIALYTVSYILLIIAVLDYKKGVAFVQDNSALWREVAIETESNCIFKELSSIPVLTKTQRQLVLTLETNRDCWTDDNPYLVSEALFVVANVFSFLRIFYFMPITEFVGPLQISLGKMLKDVLRFALILLVPYLAFFCAFYNLYRSYATGEENYFKNYYDGGFRTPEGTLDTLTWALLGLSERSDTNITKNKDLTNFFGDILYMAYHIFLNIVLLNMLIAMMSYSFDNIQKNEDIEWKFSRTKLLMTYLSVEQSAISFPLNVIPGPNTIYKFAKGIKDKCQRQEPNGEGEYEIAEAKLKLQEVVDRLLRKYIANLQDNNLPIKKGIGGKRTKDINNCPGTVLSRIYLSNRRKEKLKDKKETNGLIESPKKNVVKQLYYKNFIEETSV